MKYKVTYRNGTTKIIDTNSIKDADDFFTVAYVKNGVNQIIAVRASSEQEAKKKFMDYMQKKGRQVEFVGIKRGKEDKPGMPVIDNCVKDQSMPDSYPSLNISPFIQLRNSIDSIQDYIKHVQSKGNSDAAKRIYSRAKTDLQQTIKQAEDEIKKYRSFLDKLESGVGSVKQESIKLISQADKL